ncbi:DUF4255 domain-containing protein [Amycolatopsis sp. NPDC004079]|uniref:DUF4255 domain-containing protein n=1 Tax=Amycolatopsis sp. NPDC004079 TaxID=3154549 RepID=UPI00339ECFDC
MSDANAIEAVTEALVQLVLEGAREVESGAKVEARPPHETPGPSGDPQLNLFLYQIGIDESLRNEDPVGLRPGEHGDPQLPLVLHYLLTAYVPGGADTIAHRMLGGALRTLHEHPHLSRARLRQVQSPSNVSEQSELIRLTWQSFAEKDIYSLWSAFQTSYRLTVAFEAGPVLIDSRRPPRTAVPVLRRGALDRGPEAAASVESPYPQLTAAVPVAVGPDGLEHEQASVKLGGRVVLRGANLDQANEVRLSHPLLAGPVSIPVVPGSAAEVRFELTGPPQAFPAGLWSVAAVSGTTATNEVSLAVAPEITSGMPMTVQRDGTAAVVRLACRPPVRTGQPVLLVLGSRSVLERRAVAAQPEDPVTGADLTFDVPDAPVGTHLARLRIGGVDSLLVDRTGPKPVFDATQTVTIS